MPLLRNVMTYVWKSSKGKALRMVWQPAGSHVFSRNQLTHRICVFSLALLGEGVARRPWIPSCTACLHCIRHCWQAHPPGHESPDKARVKKTNADWADGTAAWMAYPAAPVRPEAGNAYRQRSPINITAPFCPESQAGRRSREMTLRGPSRWTRVPSGRRAYSVPQCLFRVERTLTAGAQAVRQYRYLRTLPIRLRQMAASWHLRGRVPGLANPLPACLWRGELSPALGLL